MAEPGVGSPSLTDDEAAGVRPSWDDYSGRFAAAHAGLDPRQATPPVRVWLRLAYWGGRGLAAVRLPPNAVTFAGLLLSLAVPAVVALGGWSLFVAAWLVLLSAIADSLDGALALASARTTRLGSFYDAMSDRITEASWLTALWLLGAPGPLVVACGGLAWLHEYARARASVAGVRGTAIITVAERPTRIILVLLALVLGGATFFVDPRLTSGTVTVVLAGWLVLGLLGAAGLYGRLRAALAR